MCTIWTSGRLASHPVSDSAFLSDTSSEANDKQRVSD